LKPNVFGNKADILFSFFAFARHSRSRRQLTGRAWPRPWRSPITTTFLFCLAAASATCRCSPHAASLARATGALKIAQRSHEQLIIRRQKHCPPVYGDNFCVYAASSAVNILLWNGN
jgi:hypothetical protein